MSYTHLQSQGFKYRDAGYNGILISDTTKARRDELRRNMDDFTSFTWRGVDAFSVFGMFITNKNSLKFYNGSSFSNEYTKPQFESAAGQLTGVSFQIQKIDFTVGVYWINENDYRQMINWLNPYEINTLTFGFEPNYYYQVKLASIDNTTTRTVIGHESQTNYNATFSDTFPTGENIYAKYIGTTSATYRQNHVYTYVNGICRDMGLAIESEYEYYTEFKLTFEVQGPACAYHKIPYVYDLTPQPDGDKDTLTMSLSNTNNVGTSDLNIPIQIIYGINLNNIAPLLTNNNNYILNLDCQAIYGESDNAITQTLFTLSLKDISYLANDTQYALTGNLMLQYDSENGLLFLLNGNQKYTLLNTLTTTAQGQKVVNFMQANKYMMSGKFNAYDMDIYQLKFKTTGQIINIDTGIAVTISTSMFDTDITTITVRARTNLI